MADRASTMSGWWWLSFVDNELPKGSRFLGVAIVEGVSFLAAVKAAHVRRINPGGEVQGAEMPSIECVPDRLLHRLLLKAEAEQAADLVDRAHG